MMGNVKNADHRGYPVLLLLVLALVIPFLVAGNGCSAKKQEVEVGGDPPSSSEGGSGELGSTIPEVSIEDVLAGKAATGTMVTVTGIYLGYGRQQAFGPQPLTRSDWQLASGEVAVWVSGEFPDGTDALTPGDEPITITATVAEDVVEGPGDRNQQRYYLVQSR